MPFSIPIKKEIKQQKEQKKKVITYNLKFIDTAKHMNSALSTLVNNLSEINKCNCEEDKDKRIKIKIKKVNSKEKVITKCKTCNSKESQLVSELIKIFPNTYQLCDKSSKKFILLLKKVHILMNIWILWIDLMKQLCLTLKNFIVTYN